MVEISFEETILRELGAAPRDVIPDGKFHSFPIGKHKDHGWYIYHDGAFPAGAFGDWGTGACHKWRLKNGASKLTPADRALIRAQQAKREAEIAKGQAQAAKEAAALWEKASPATPDHPYLIKKRVKPHGIKESDGRLIVQVFIDGEIASVQKIDADGLKLFQKGGRTGGGSYLIGEIGGEVIIAEGYATVATIHEMTGLPVVGAFSAGNLMTVAKATRAKYPTAKIVIAADDDFGTERDKGVNPGIRDARAAAKEIGAEVVIPPFDRNKGDAGTDWNDFFVAYGEDACHGAFNATAPDEPDIAATDAPEAKEEPPESAQVIDFEIARLAKLREVDYEKARKESAKQLNVRSSVLDRLVAAKRPPDDSKPGSGRTLKLETPEAWPYFVNGAALLNEFVAEIRKYVVLTEEDADAVALWCLHTFAFEAFHCTPRIAITSPEPRCGKTTLLDVIEGLAARPLPTANISVAAVFRTVEIAKPTLLIDEADTFLGENEELRGILNSGHRRGGQVIRTVGDDHEPRVFSTHCPCAIAMIGKLPSTLADRSVSVSLKRRLPSEPISRFRFKKAAEVFEALARKGVRWAEDNIRRIESSDPDLPGNLFNRDADNWEPLFTIAVIAGGDWPARVKNAAVGKVGAHEEEGSLKTQLLMDVRDALAEKGVVGDGGIRSADLVAALKSIAAGRLHKTGSQGGSRISRFGQRMFTSGLVAGRPKHSWDMLLNRSKKPLIATFRRIPQIHPRLPVLQMKPMT